MTAGKTPGAFVGGDATFGAALCQLHVLFLQPDGEIRDSDGCYQYADENAVIEEVPGIRELLADLPVKRSDHGGGAQRDLKPVLPP